MKVFRFNSKAIGKAASKKPAVIIISAIISDNKAERLKSRFPGSLLITEVHPGTPARDGYFSILRIHRDELAGFDYDLKGCRAMLIEGVTGLFYSEAEQFCSYVAQKASLTPNRIRLCCSLLSEQGGCNYSCYSAAALRDYAAEMGFTGIFPTSKKECLLENSLCLCVKN